MTPNTKSWFAACMSTGAHSHRLNAYTATATYVDPYTRRISTTGWMVMYGARIVEAPFKWLGV